MSSILTKGTGLGWTARSGLCSAAPLSAAALSFALSASGCNAPDTSVVLENEYPASATHPFVVYQAYWQAVSFEAPVPPGSSSAPQPTVAASANTAWAILAPGWDPTSSTKPTSFIVLRSENGFSVQLDDTLQIPVNDTTFVGNCAAGRFLTQSEADFITSLVFPTVFVGKHYDAATCTTTPMGDGGQK
jgi:hypothetical protein